MKKKIILLTILLNFYVFHQFVVFNLLGIRSQVLFAACLMSTTVFLTGSLKLNQKYNYVLAILFVSISLGYLFWSPFPQGAAEQVFSFFIAIIILRMNRNEFNFSVKWLIIFTALLNLLSLIAFVVFFVNPGLSNAVQIPFSSHTSSEWIPAKSFLNYFSLVLPERSSDSTYSFLGYTLPRLNGLTAEPSATVVLYLAPASLLYFYKNKLLVGLAFFTLVSGFALYGSGISQIIAFLSLILLAFTFLLKTAKKISRTTARVLPFLFLLILILILSNSSYSKIVLGKVVQTSGSSLLASKLDKEAVSFIIRSDGIRRGLNYALTRPFGYPDTYRGAGTGVFYHVTQLSGWLGLAILVLIVREILRPTLASFKQNISLLDRFILSFMCSCLLVSLFISGYGWTRISGVILYSLIYKGLNLLESHQLSAYH